MIGAAGPTPLWYAARSTGYVSLYLLTAVLVLGILTSMRWAGRDWPRFLSQAVHRNLSLMVLVFLLIHILASIIDPFAGITVLNTVAPFTGSYRPVWLGLGVVSMELLVALVVTSLLRHRIGFRAWRLIHWAAYACWPLAILHTLGTGTDVKAVWAGVSTLACVGAVVLAIAWRLFGGEGRVALPLRLTAVTVTAAATIALFGFAAAGPLHSGWARAAGTPDRLLALSSGTAQGGSTPAPGVVALPVGVTDQLSGTITQAGDTVKVRLTDARDSNLSILITVVGNSTTGNLTVTESGAVVCNVPASVSQDLRATCGTTSVDISVSQQADGTIAGQMVTQSAPQ